MRDRVVGERFTVRAGDAERELTGGTDLGGRGDLAQQVAVLLERETPHRPGTGRRGVLVVRRRAVLHLAVLHRVRPGDRKSTRLNSSHVAISYAVFCLKKKTHMRLTI